MSEEDDDDGKEFEASQRKLDKSRQDGDVPIGQDLITASVYFAMAGSALAVGGPFVSELGGRLSIFLSDPMGDGPFVALPGLVALVAALLAVPFAAALLSALAQRALTFAPKRIQPKLNRISPLKSLKQKFGRDGLFNFAKSAVKLVVFSTALVVVAWNEMDFLLIVPSLSPAGGFAALLGISIDFIVLSACAVAVVGALDFGWQRASHLRRNRMTRKEMTDESKDSEGDPHLKQARRQKAQSIALNQMLTDVPNADVVIVNPQHYAVALRWSRAERSAPVCVAKGMGEIAARIRERALDAGVPIRRDPPTARAIHATVDLGQEIPHELYRAVAAAIRFADRIRKLVK